MVNDILSARANQKKRIYKLVIDRFNLLAAEQGLSIRDLAERLNQRPVDVERLLKNPQYWTLDIVSDLLFSMESELDTDIKLSKHTGNLLNFDVKLEERITA